MSQNDLHRRVGDFITPIEITLRINDTVDEALRNLRKHREHEKIFYLYVIDSDRKLRGVVSTRKILTSQPHERIKDLVDEDVIAISANHTLKEAMEHLTGNRLLAIPVVDEEGRLLGVVDIQLYLEEAVDMMKTTKSATDLFQVLGLKMEEGKARSPWKLYSTRMPWIFCNMIGGIACAIISRFFELVLVEVILLAMFIPLVLTLSESISMQSMTYSLQLLNRPRPTFKKMLHSVISESRMVFFLGLTSGLIVGGLSIFWGEGIPPAIAISAGVIIGVTISGVIGAAVPLILHALKLDPKVAAGPVVLMLVDIFTTAVYLGLSTWWLL